MFKPESCTDFHLEVRALVGLCKLGASGGSDAALRPFADGSSQKLAEACRFDKYKYNINYRYKYNINNKYKWSPAGGS